MSIDITGTNHNAPKTSNFDGKEFTYYSMVRLPGGEEDEDGWDVSAMHLNSANGRAFIAFLGLDPGQGPDGEVTVAEMRRAILRAVNTFDRKVVGFTREDSATYGAPRDNGDGTVTLHPLRTLEFGIDESYFAARLAQLATLVEALAANGATHISWG
jgi:hypothetical protein